MRPREIIIHHSASSFGDAALIDKWHRRRGWRGLGYHYVILNGRRFKGGYAAEDDGLLEKGRDTNRRGAHCRGHNGKSIGICLIGPSGNHSYTAKQKNALLKLVQLLIDRYGIPVNKIYGHKELDVRKPQCPEIDMDDFRKAFT
jgi:N-acetyl-anhydromuramyl-L-alanine amidase AmpD